MSLLLRLLLLPLALLVALRSASAAEPLAGLVLERNYTAYENEVLRALGDAAEAWEKQAGAMPAFDPQAAAMKAGDWASAQAEIAAAVKSDDRVLQARGHARAAWLLARLGAAHYADERADQGLHEPTAQGEVLLARAWLTWDIGDFALADEQAALAARVEPAAPAWAWAEWRQFRARHARAATAVGMGGAPAEVLTAAYLDYADRLRAAGAHMRPWQSHRHSAQNWSKSSNPRASSESAEAITQPNYTHCQSRGGKGLRPFPSTPSQIFFLHQTLQVTKRDPRHAI